MMSPRYMPLLHDFWRLSHPKPNEQVGKKIAERQEVLLSKWETIFNSQRQVTMKHLYCRCISVSVFVSLEVISETNSTANCASSKAHPTYG